MRLKRRMRIEIEPLDKKFNFKLTAAAYSFSWNYDGKHYRTIIKYSDRNIGVVAWEENHKIIVEVYSNENYLSKEDVEHEIRNHLGTDENLEEFYKLCRGDPLLKDVIEGIHSRKVDIWYASIIAVAQQNASFRQGWKMIWNLLSRYGERFLLEGLEVELKYPPNPRLILERGEQVLKDSGYGYRSRTLMEIAKILIENGEDFLKKNLTKIRGVGKYTYGLIMMLAYRDYTNPVIDRWVKGLYETVGVTNVEEYYRKYWGRYQALATWMLTIMLDAAPLSKAIERVRRGDLKPSFSGITPLTLWRYY
ncbi:MAG: hypothetical protein GXO26_01890 [Crenarchaeota archaeon]|nr:hypothetical protein [Thermoproteota archaeon]